MDRMDLRNVLGRVEDVRLLYSVHFLHAAHSAS